MFSFPLFINSSEALIPMLALILMDKRATWSGCRLSCLFFCGIRFLILRPLSGTCSSTPCRFKSVTLLVSSLADLQPQLIVFVGENARDSWIQADIVRYNGVFCLPLFRYSNTCSSSSPDVSSPSLQLTIDAPSGKRSLLVALVPRLEISRMIPPYPTTVPTPRRLPRLSL